MLFFLANMLSHLNMLHRKLFRGELNKVSWMSHSKRVKLHSYWKKKENKERNVNINWFWNEQWLCRYIQVLHLYGGKTNNVRLICNFLFSYNDHFYIFISNKITSKQRVTFSSTFFLHPHLSLIRFSLNTRILL